MEELKKQLQLQNEMLLIIMKSNSEIFENVSEDLLDYYTENVLKDAKLQIFEDEFGGLFKEKVHCPKCNTGKSILWSGINPVDERSYRRFFCKNCKTFFREYLDNGELEIFDE